MMKKKSHRAKYAFITSLLSLLLCMAMLAGSTFAWFTETVHTGANKIVTGNLDVALEYYDGSAWKQVGESTSIFSSVSGSVGSSWEPGHLEVAYLRVHNAGALAVKYQLSVKPVSETAGIKVDGRHKVLLSEYLAFGHLKTNNNGVDASVTAYADVNAVKTAFWPDTNDESIITGVGNYIDTDNQLDAGETRTYSLALYMPDTEKARNALCPSTGPTLTLGVTLTAAQAASEGDSFGSDYDGGALLANDDGTYSDGTGVYVMVDGARIAVKPSTTISGLYTDASGNYYASTERALAVAAAKPGFGTVKLLQNITLSNSSTNENNALTLGKGTIDLCGNTLTIGSDNVSDGAIGVGVGYAEGLTIQNGNVTVAATGSLSASNHKLTLDCVVLSAGDDRKEAITSGPSGGELIIRASTITGAQSASRNYSDLLLRLNQGSKLVVDNSKIDGAVIILTTLTDGVSNNSVTITGGDFTNATFYLEPKDMPTDSNPINYTVTGGTFSQNGYEFFPTLPSGYEWQINSDGTYSVVASTGAATTAG